MDRDEQVLETLREEAQTMFRAKLEASQRADRILGFGVTFIAIAATAGIAREFNEVMLLTPTALSLLLSYVLHLYADLVVYGTARARLEEVLAERLQEEVLIGETVGPVRHGGRNNPSISAVQAFYLLGTVGAAIAGAVIAEDVSSLALVVYLVVTVAALLIVGLSWRDVRRSWTHAAKRVAQWPEQTGRLPLS